MTLIFHILTGVRHVARKKREKNALRIMLVICIGLLPFLLRKPPIKDWLLVFSLNALSNGIVDKILVKKNYLKYPTRLLPNLFSIHILFDYLIYPTFTIIFNQVTMKDRPIKILMKLLLIVTPLTFIETVAEKKTNMIEWKKSWKWYYTFFYIVFKSSWTRLVIATVRTISRKQQKVGG